MGDLRQALMSFAKESFKTAALRNLFPLEQKKGVSMNEHSPEGEMWGLFIDNYR